MGEKNTNEYGENRGPGGTNWTKISKQLELFDDGQAQEDLQDQETPNTVLAKNRAII